MAKPQQGGLVDRTRQVAAPARQTTPLLKAAIPGTNSTGLPLTRPEEINSINGFATESGFISLSVDGLGSNNVSGTIQVDKPAGGHCAQGIYGGRVDRIFGTSPRRWRRYDRWQPSGVERRSKHSK